MKSQFTLVLTVMALSIMFDSYLVTIAAFTRDPQGCGSESLLVHFQVTALSELLTHTCLSPSSIIWYQPMGSDALQPGR